MSLIYPARASVEDITYEAEMLSNYEKLVANNYRRFSKNGLSIDEVRSDLFGDRSRYSTNSRTIAIVDSSGKISAGCSYLYGNFGKPSKTMRLVEPQSGWTQDIFSLCTRQFPIELRRLAIDAEYLTIEYKRDKRHLLLIGELFEGIWNSIEHHHQMNTAWALAPSHVIRTVSKAGVHSRDICSISPIENEQNKPLFDRYSIYWRSLNIKLWQVSKTPLSKH